jgi:hypothetical protein
VAVGFVDYTPYLPQAMLLFLVLGVGALALAANRSGRWTPLLLGTASASIAMTREFAVDSQWTTSSVTVLLMAAISRRQEFREAQARDAAGHGEGATRTRRVDEEVSRDGARGSEPDQS